MLYVLDAQGRPLFPDTASLSVRDAALEPMRENFRLAKAELGTAAGFIGAAFVAFEALGYS